MSNAAVVSQFMDIDFCKDSNLVEKGVNDLQMYF